MSVLDNRKKALSISKAKFISEGAEYAYWKNLSPSATGALNDIKKKVLIGEGYTGSLQDMEASYWKKKATNLVLNSAFGTTEGWMKDSGWSISNGKLLFASGSPQYARTKYNLNTTAGKTYQLRYTIDSISSGSINVFAWDAYDALGAQLGIAQFVGAPNQYTLNFTAISSQSSIGIQANDLLQSIQIDNVEMYEV